MSVEGVGKIDHETLVKYQPAMWAYAIRLAESHEDAEDIVQTANMWAMSYDNTPDNLDYPGAWMRMFVKRAWQRHTRREWREISLTEKDVENISIEPTQFNHVLLGEMMDKIERLPARERDAFKAYVMDGDSSPVAARRLGYKDKRSILNYVHRARRRFNDMAALAA